MKKFSLPWRSMLLQGMLLLLVLVAVQWYQTRNTATGPAPALDGVTLQGQVASLAATQPTLVHFWATWCPVCRFELDTIDALAKEYPVITVAMEDTSSREILAYMQAQQVDFPVLHDPDGELADAYGVRAVPTSFIVNTRGEISSTTVGYTTGLGLRIRLWLAAWLGS